VTLLIIHPLSFIKVENVIIFFYILIKVATFSAINIVKVMIFIERQLIYLPAIETLVFPAELFSNRK